MIGGWCGDRWAGLLCMSCLIKLGNLFFCSMYMYVT